MAQSLKPEKCGAGEENSHLNLQATKPSEAGRSVPLTVGTWVQVQTTDTYQLRILG